jgi:hypothetical protein
MFRHLTLAVLIVGLLLAMFAERLGLPAETARSIVFVLAGLALVCLAISTITTRFGVFLGGDGVLSPAEAITLRAALLVMAGTLGALQGLDRTSLLLGLAAGHIAGSLILPAYRFPAHGAAPLPPGLTPGEAALLTAAISILAFALLLGSPMVWSGASGVLGTSTFTGGISPLLLLAAALAVLGGFAAVRVVASAVFLLAFLSVFAPLASEAMREAGHWAEILRRVNTVPNVLPTQAILALPRHDLLSGGVLGFGVAAIAAPAMARLEGRAARVIVPVFALIAAGLAVLLPLLATSRLDQLIAGEIAGQPAARWPGFAFDEGLAGWLAVCGQAPRDAFDVAQVCRNAGIPLPVPAQAIALDPAMKPMAIAVMQGLPLIAGLVWVIVAETALVLVVALCLLTAAAGFSELVLFRLLQPSTLKAGRLALARLSIIALAAGFAMLAPVADPGMARFLLVGAILLMGSVLAGFAIRRLVRAINHWRERRHARAMVTMAQPVAAQPAE